MTPTASTSPLGPWRQLLAATGLLLGSCLPQAYGQVEVAPWGNVLGMRQQGHLLAFETSLRTVGPNWGRVLATGKERQRPKYTREGPQHVITTVVDSVAFTETVTDTQSGQATVTVALQALANRELQGAFFALAFPHDSYSAATIEFLDAAGQTVAKQAFSSLTADVPVTASRLRIVAPTRQVEITLPEAAAVVLKQGSVTAKTFQLYLPIQPGSLRKGQTAQKTFGIMASGEVDRTPVQLTVNSAQPGRPFEGFGGNFRLQNPKYDPTVIDYSLNDLTRAPEVVAVQKSIPVTCTPSARQPNGLIEVGV